MLSSELIKILEGLIKEYGDLEILIPETDWNYGSTRISNIKIEENSIILEGE